MFESIIRTPDLIAVKSGDKEFKGHGVLDNTDISVKTEVNQNDLRNMQLKSEVVTITAITCPTEFLSKTTTSAPPALWQKLSGWPVNMPPSSAR